MWKDPIVEEIRKARHEYAAKFGNNLIAIYDDLKATERKSGRKIVSLPAKRPGGDEIRGIQGDVPSTPA